MDGGPRTVVLNAKAAAEKLRQADLARKAGGRPKTTAGPHGQREADQQRARGSLQRAAGRADQEGHWGDPESRPWRIKSW